jgi:signal transduction histidine kinase
VGRYEANRKQPPAAAQSLSQAMFSADDGPQTISLAVAPVQNLVGAGNNFVIVLSDISHVLSMTGDVIARITKLKEQQALIERNIAEARAAELQARSRIEKLNALESSAKDGGQDIRRLEEELVRERERFYSERAHWQSSFQQLLDTNKLKSEFIVNCGHEIENSVQSTIGLADLLDNGAYGALSPNQREAVREILNFGNRIKGDIASLVEYGAARIR